MNLFRILISFGCSETCSLESNNDEDKGACWLSLEEKIVNPFFGDRMLHCGKVQEVFD